MLMTFGGKATRNIIRLPKRQLFPLGDLIQRGFPMTRHLIAASLAVLMIAAPVAAFAADPAPAASTDAPAPKKAKTHKHKAKTAKPAADTTAPAAK
jgi:hypothetical protein